MRDRNWKEQAPRSIVTLGQATELCQTAPARALCNVYRILMDEAGGAVPRKADIDPSRLGSLLNNLFLFAVTIPDGCVVRLVADRARHHTGLERGWSDYYSNVPANRLENAAWAMNMAVGKPCGFRADVRHEYEFDRTRDFESLLLPFASDEDDVDGFLLGTSQLLEHDAEKGLPSERSLGNIVLRRDLIDIGHGVDETFHDVVPR